jgi:hypothetical protein
VLAVVIFCLWQAVIPLPITSEISNIAKGTMFFIPVYTKKQACRILNSTLKVHRAAGLHRRVAKLSKSEKNQGYLFAVGIINNRLLLPYGFKKSI